jgi:hypothetical protein
VYLLRWKLLSVEVFKVVARLLQAVDEGRSDVPPSCLNLLWADAKIL